MKNILIAIRSIFKKGRHNVMKIVSLGIGLAVGLVLIAKVYFEQSYDDFYPDRDRSGIAFGMGEAFPRISKGEYFDICYTLQENEFMGKSDIQMMIRDLKFKEE